MDVLSLDAPLALAITDRDGVLCCGLSAQGRMMQ